MNSSFVLPYNSGLLYRIDDGPPRSSMAEQKDRRTARYVPLRLPCHCVRSQFHISLSHSQFLLCWLTLRIYCCLEATIWAVPSLLENAIAVSFIGLLLGPMYPILVRHSGKILPKWLYAGCIGLISGVGQAGAAVLPFLTGLLAARFGISSLQPL